MCASRKYFLILICLLFLNSCVIYENFEYQELIVNYGIEGEVKFDLTPLGITNESDYKAKKNPYSLTVVYSNPLESIQFIEIIDINLVGQKTGNTFNFKNILSNDPEYGFYNKRFTYGLSIKPLEFDYEEYDVDLHLYIHFKNGEILKLNMNERLILDYEKERKSKIFEGLMSV